MPWFAPIIAGAIAAAGSAGAAGISAASNGSRMTAEEEARQAMLERLRRIQDPKYSADKYSTQGFTPEGYAAPEDAQYQLAQVDPRMRDAQMAALGSLQDRYNGVADAQMNAENYAAMNQANRLAQGREGAIAQNAQMRGVGGGGLEFVMQQQAAQDSANRAQQGTLQATQMAAMQKLAGQNAYLSGMGNVRGQDFNQAQFNADAINRFNMHNTDARNSANMANTDAANKAAMFNIGNSANDRARNIDRGDRNANTHFNQQMEKAGGSNQIDASANAAQGQLAASNAALGAAGLQTGTNLAGAAISSWGQPQQPKDSYGNPSTKYDWEKWQGR